MELDEMRDSVLGRILKLEFYKAWKDTQLRWIFLVMCVYAVFVSFLSVNPAFYRDATVSQLLADGTVDCAMINMFIGLLGASVFSIDYTYGTYQNLRPYAGDNRLFAGKCLCMIGVIAVGLAAWYLAAFAEAILRSGQWCTAQDITAYVYRFTSHFFMVLCHASLLALIGMVLKRRALLNISTIVLWFAYAFIPINGQRLFDYVAGECRWGRSTSIGLVVSGCMLFSLCMLGGRKIIFREGI